MYRSILIEPEIEEQGQPEKFFNRNYLLLWQGQTVSRLGNQAFLVAMQFWIKHATGSAAMVGLLSMFASLPGVVLGPVAGALADRFSRRNIVVLCDFLRGTAVLVMSSLMFLFPENNQVALAALFVVAVFNSILTTFFDPAISASIPDLVPRGRVTSANSLGQLSSQVTLFLGQGLGGTLYRVLGAPVMFFFDGVSFLYAAASEAFISIPQVIQQSNRGWREQLHEFRQDIVAGLRYVVQRRGLREMLFVSVFLNFFTVPVLILLPFFVEDVLQVKVDWYGFLLAGSGIGTMLGYVLAGALRLSGRTRAGLLMFFIFLDSLGYGMLGLVRSAPLALALSVVGGISSGFVGVNIVTLLQITTPREIRGRVFGVMGTIAGSLSPIAMGLAGVVADLLDQNIPLIYLSCGAIMTALTVLVISNRDFRKFLVFERGGDDEETQS